MIDDRLITVGIEVDGQLKEYTGLAIKTTGTKYGNPTQNECEVEIFNLAKSTRDYILTEANPFENKDKRKKLVLKAGRESYGTSQLYIGDIVEAIPSQPPDIGLKIKALTGNFEKGKIKSTAHGAKASLSQIAKGVAARNGLKLDMQASDKQIANYSHSGAVAKEVDKLGWTGGVNAYVDDDKLVIKEINQPLNGDVRYLSKDSGMIGIPELTEYGVKVKMLYDNKTTLGTALDVTSDIYPTATGQYVVYKLSWELCSRDTPFYLVAEAKRLDGKTGAKAKKKASKK